MSVIQGETGVPIQDPKWVHWERLRYLNPIWYWRSHRFLLVLSILVGAFFLFALWRTIVVPIYPGEQGVYWSRFGTGTQPDRIGEGFAVKFPWDKIYIYDVRLKKVEGETRLLTRDGLLLSVKWAFWFEPQKDELPLLHQTIGPDYIEKVVSPIVVASLRKTIGNFRPEEIYATDEATLLAEIDGILRESLSAIPVEFRSLMIRQILLPKAVTDAIEEKLVAEQNLLTYEYRLQGEDAERKRRQIEAQGIERFKRISGVDILQWRGIDATLQMAKSPNTRLVVIGTSADGMPIILNTNEIPPPAPPVERPGDSDGR